MWHITSADVLTFVNYVNLQTKSVPHGFGNYIWGCET